MKHVFMRGSALLKYGISVIAFSLLLLLLPFPAFAEESSAELITTEEALVEALHNAGDGDTILVGDIDFAYASPMGMTLSKSVVIKSGKSSQAVFSGGAFAVMGGAAEQDTINVRFENIWFKGMNDIENTGFSETNNIAAATVMRPAMFFARCVEASFESCRFTGCSMANGGAVYGIYSSEDSRGFRLSLSFEGCELNANAGGYGGAVYLSGAGNVFLSMKNCVLSRNVSAFGGAIYADQSAVALENCVISDNRFVDFFPETDVRGGGIYVGRGSLDMKNCRVTGNESKNGGGIALAYTEGLIDGCVISQNTARDSGGGIWNENSGNNLVTVMNTTIAQNRARDSGALCISETDALLGGGGVGKTYLLLSTVSENEAAMPEYEGRLSAFGCAFHGENRGEALPSAENEWCHYTQTPHGGDPLAHMHGSAPIDGQALSTVANGKFANHYGTFFAGDNARDDLNLTVISGENAEKTSVAYGDAIELPEYEQDDGAFEGWYLPDGAEFNAEGFYVGAGVDELEITAKLTPTITPSPVPTEQPAVDDVRETDEKSGPNAGAYIAAAVAVLALAIAAVYFIRKRAPENAPAENAPAEIMAEKPIALSEDSIERTLELWEEAKLLTAREREVVKLLLAGKQRREIAKELFITEHTVKDHVSNSYKKLNVKNKTELMAKANTFK